jgi:hypothetical protein
MGEVYDAAAWDADQNVISMLNWLQLSLKKVKTSELKSKAGRRRLRLFLCAAVRRVWHVLPDEVSRTAVEVAERFADGQAGQDELAAAANGVLTLLQAESVRGHRQGPQVTAAYAAMWACCKTLGPPLDNLIRTSRRDDAAEPLSSGPLCDILRDIYGNPFRRVAVERRWLTWSGGTIPQMAQAIYDERAYDRLPPLADALEDAGCADVDILDHCRGSGPHVRGCWVLDLLRGQA